MILNKHKDYLRVICIDGWECNTTLRIEVNEGRPLVFRLDTRVSDELFIDKPDISMETDENGVTFYIKRLTRLPGTEHIEIDMDFDDYDSLYDFSIRDKQFEFIINSDIYKRFEVAFLEGILKETVFDFSEYGYARDSRYYIGTFKECRNNDEYYYEDVPNVMIKGTDSRGVSFFGVDWRYIEKYQGFEIYKYTPDQGDTEYYKMIYDRKHVFYLFKKLNVYQGDLDYSVHDAIYAYKGLFLNKNVFARYANKSNKDAMEFLSYNYSNFVIYFDGFKETYYFNDRGLAFVIYSRFDDYVVTDAILEGLNIVRFRIPANSIYYPYSLYDQPSVGYGYIFHYRYQGLEEYEEPDWYENLRAEAAAYEAAYEGYDYHDPDLFCSFEEEDFYDDEDEGRDCPFTCDCEACGYNKDGMGCAYLYC